MAIPKRIQYRGRQRGWHLPEGAVYVGRHMSTTYGRWGNPFKVGDVGVSDREAAVARFATMLTMRRNGFPLPSLPPYPSDEEIRAELAGKSLACWCPLPKPGEVDLCHASVLLEAANGVVAQLPAGVA